MKVFILIVGVIFALLGGLWLLQGLGIVHIRPILCFADCELIQGASPTWAIIGFIAFAAGMFAIFYALNRRTTS